MAKVVGIILVVVSFLLNIFLPLSVRPPVGALLTLPKMLAAALAPYAGIAALLGLLLVLLCGESPDMYDLASPINHVSPNSPGTLLFHGEHDTAAPTASSRRLYHMLVEVGVPAVYIEMSWNEHAYDIIFPQISPSALLTLYYLDHFLAFVAQSEDFGEEIGGIR
jgi:acetyl esterase/lipase